MNIVGTAVGRWLGGQGDWASPAQRRGVPRPSRRAEPRVQVKRPKVAEPEKDPAPTEPGERYHTMMELRDCTDATAEQYWEIAAEHMKSFGPKLLRQPRAKILPVTIGNRVYPLTLDTGATLSLITEELYEVLHRDGMAQREPCKTKVMGIGCKEAVPFLGYCYLNVQIGHSCICTQFYICEHMPLQMILGMDFMESFRFVIDCCEQGKVTTPWGTLETLNRAEMVAVLWDLCVDPESRGMPTGRERLRAFLQGS